MKLNKIAFVVLATLTATTAAHASSSANFVGQNIVDTMVNGKTWYTPEEVRGQFNGLSESDQRGVVDMLNANGYTGITGDLQIKHDVQDTAKAEADHQAIMGQMEALHTQWTKQDEVAAMKAGQAAGQAAQDKRIADEVAKQQAIVTGVKLTGANADRVQPQIDALRKAEANAQVEQNNRQAESDKITADTKAAHDRNALETANRIRTSSQHPQTEGERMLIAHDYNAAQAQKGADLRQANRERTVNQHPSVTIVKGDAGVNGTNGTNGYDGVNGRDGKNGTNGKDADMTFVSNLQSGIKQAQATGEYAQSRAEAAYQYSEANHQASVATNKRVAQNSADIADHEKRITSLEQSTTSKFSELNDKVEQNRKKASAGIAGVAAMANIPQVSQGATFSVGAGAGTYDSETGLAVGFSGRINHNVVTKASVSATTQHDFVVGAGVSYEW